MNFNEVISNRYSCRKFDDKKVERELLTELMEAGRIAPSSCNVQGWMFIAIDDPRTIERLGELMVQNELRVNTYAGTVPAYIAIISRPLGELSESKKILFGSHGAEWRYLDIGIAASQIMLAATNKGLGNVAIGYFDRPQAKKLLKLPEDHDPVLFVGLGYPENNSPRKHVRLEREAIFRYNDFDTLEP